MWICAQAFIASFQAEFGGDTSISSVLLYIFVASVGLPLLVNLAAVVTVRFRCN
jgi:hypothetical protein